MRRSKEVPRRRQALPPPGPGVASAAAWRRRPYSKPRQIPPSGLDEFLKKCRFVRDLLVLRRILACSIDDAAAWTLPFADDGDPTFPIIEWLDAGWRDPHLVDIALQICGTREQAEMCMGRIDRDVGSRYEHGFVLALADAMLALTKQANDA
jgi:hypothetical protein